MILAALALALAAQPYNSFRLSNARFGRMSSSGYVRCQREARTTYAMRECIWAEQRRFDARLNATYRAAMVRLPSAAARLRLRNLERQWLATRWNDCRRRYANEDGTLSLISQDLCVVQEVARRAAWLERYER